MRVFESSPANHFFIMTFQFVHEHVEDRVLESMSEEMEPESTGLPGYGLAITQNRNSTCFPMALFKRTDEYVFYTFLLAHQARVAE